MEAIDRLDWTAGFSFTSYGVRVGVRTNDASWLARIHDCLPPRWKPTRHPIVDRLYSIVAGGGEPGRHMRRFTVLYGDHVRLARSLQADAVMNTLEIHLRRFVAEASPNRVFVHAGVVRWKGRALVIPGRSFSGKSTMIAALVEAGATYYSDEFAVFDSKGRVHGFQKPLELRCGADHRQTRVAIPESTGVPQAGAVPVGLVVVGQFKAGGRWRPRRLSAGQAALAMLAHTVSAKRRPATVLRTLHNAVAGAVALQGPRGEAHQLARSWLARLESGR
jgi:hypothetical protein